jgi:hypothetical protein
LTSARQSNPSRLLNTCERAFPRDRPLHKCRTLPRLLFRFKPVTRCRRSRVPSCVLLRCQVASRYLNYY